MQKLFEGIVYAIFDKIEGPKVVYSSESVQMIANTVAMRSYIALGLAQKEFEIVELTLPVFNEKNLQTHFAFNMLFNYQLKHATKTTDANIGVIACVFRAGQETNFYKMIPDIRKEGIDIIGLIKDIMRKYDNLDEHARILVIQKITDWETKNKSKETTLAVSEPSQEIISSQPGIGTTRDPDLDFLKQIKHKDLNQLVQAAILGEPILIISDKKNFNRFVDTLYLFHFRGVARKTYMESKLIPPRDNEVVGINGNIDIPEDIQSTYSLIFNLENCKFYNKNRLELLQFSNDWTDEIKKAESVEILLKSFKDYLEDKNLYVSLILDTLAKTEETGKVGIEETRKLILNLQQLMIKTDYEFVIEVAIRLNPFLEEFLRKEI